MSWLKAIFAAPETITKAVDAGIAAGDALIYTGEEKATNALSQVLKGWKDQYGPRAITRRVLAILFCVNYLIDLKIVLIQGILFYTLDVGSERLMDFLIQIIKYQTYVILTITTFYFGSYGWERIKSLGEK